MAAIWFRPSVLSASRTTSRRAREPPEPHPFLRGASPRASPESAERSGHRLPHSRETPQPTPAASSKRSCLKIASASFAARTARCARSRIASRYAHCSRRVSSAAEKSPARNSTSARMVPQWITADGDRAPRRSAPLRPTSSRASVNRPTCACRPPRYGTAVSAPEVAESFLVEQLRASLDRLANRVGP